MKIIKPIFGVLVSLLFLILIFTNIDFSKVLTGIKTVNYYFLIPAIGIQILSFWVRSLRWSYILRNIKRISTRKLFPIVSISYMINNTLPFRLGEIARAYLISAKENVSKASAFSTIILERVFDGLTLMLYLGVILLVYPFPEWVQQIGVTIGLIFIGSLIFIILLVSMREKTVKLINTLLRLLPERIRNKVSNSLENFIDGFDIIKDKKSLIPIVSYSILIWLMEAYMFFALAEAFNFNNTEIISFFTLAVVNFGIMIPSSPGYIGTFEYFIIKSLEVFSISKEIALSFALILRVAQYTPITLIGFVFFIKEGYSISKLTRFKERKKHD